MADENILKGCRVLVVEDETIVALDVCENLQDFGCEILGPAPSVAKALAVLETQTPDVALLDENLDGEVVTPIAETLHRRNISFAVMSGYNRSRTGGAILDDAPRIAKPASTAAIVKVLIDLIASKSA